MELDVKLDLNCIERPHNFDNVGIVVDNTMTPYVVDRELYALRGACESESDQTEAHSNMRKFETEDEVEVEDELDNIQVQ